MKVRMTRARLLVGALLTVGLLAGAQPDAKAECLYLKAYVKRKNAAPIWVYGEHNPCVTATPWPYLFEYEDNDTTTLIGPDGTYGGSYIQAKFPVPSI